MKHVIFGSFLSALTMASTLAMAGPALPTVVGLKGDAKVLTKKGENLPALLYEGEKYFYFRPKIGQQIEVGNLISCSSDCRIKLVYPSGTSIYVAPGTTFQVLKAEEGSKGESSILQLLYGRIRSVVSKTHTSQWSIRTRSAVSGVRGTDFLTHHIQGQGTEVSVLSGKVEVQSLEGAKATVALTPNQSTTQDAHGDFTAQPLTKAQVLTALETTVVPVAPAEAGIQDLDAKSKAVTIDEIRQSQPEVFREIKDPERLNMEELNRKLIERPLIDAKSTSAKNATPESIDKDLENYKKFLGEGK